MNRYLLASLAALLAGAFAFPAKTSTSKSHPVEADAADLSILRRATRLVLVVADEFDGPDAHIQLYERKGNRTWAAVGEPLEAVVGREGLAWWPSFTSFA